MDTLIIAQALIYLGVSGLILIWFYERYFGDRAMAIKAATAMVGGIRDELENGFDLDLDDVTVVVSQNTLDTIDVGNVKLKRRPRTKAPFRSWLIKIAKAKFGTPKRTEGNRMCVRKFMYDHCVEHGVLARHIWENVDIATEMVFVPTKSELHCAAIKHVTEIKRDINTFNALGGGSHTTA